MASARHALIAACTFLLLSLPDLAITYWSTSAHGLSFGAAPARGLSEASKIEWGHVDVPIKAATFYDEICDDRSPHFKLRNKKQLEEEGIEGQSWASQIGACRFALYLVKLILAWLSPPEMPVKEVWLWEREEQQPTAWTGMHFDFLRDPMLGLMGYSASEVLAPPQFSKKTSTFLQVKLSQPAKKLGIMMPWNTQCQAAIYVGQLLQGIVEVAFASRRGLRFFSSMDFWVLTFRIEIFGPVLYALVRSLITAVTVQDLVGPWQLDWSWYPWRLGVASLVQGFRKLTIALQLTTMTLLAFPFAPSLVLGLAPGILVGYLLACSLGRCWRSQRAAPMEPGGSRHEELKLLVAGEGHDDGGSSAAALEDDFAEADLAARSSLRSPVVLVGAILTSLAWLPIMSSFMKVRFSADTYLCSFSYIEVFDFRMDSVAEYIIIVAVLTCLLILAYVLLRVINGQVFQITMAIIHMLWIVQSLSSSSVVAAQKEQLKKALLVMKASSEAEDLCTKADAERLVVHLSDANGRVTWASAVLLGKHLRAAEKAQASDKLVTLASVQAEGPLKRLLLGTDPDASRAALETLRSASIPVTEYREQELYQARLAEQMDRWAEMVEHMLNVCRCGEALSVEERNMASVAFKNWQGEKRSAHRILRSVRHGEQEKGLDTKQSQIKMDEISAEMRAAFTHLSQAVDNLLQLDPDTESKIVYLKMKADYNKYLVETEESGDQHHLHEAKRFYEEVTALAKESLAPTSPIFLGVYLNYTVFLYEMMLEKEPAIRLAETTFENAIADLDNVTEDQYKDSTLIMQLLRDNITLWTDEEEEKNKA